MRLRRSRQAALPAPDTRSRGSLIGRGALETIGFRGISLPLAFAISIVTSRWLLPEGRGAYVLALLSVEIASRLLANDGAVIHYIGRGELSSRAIITQGLALDFVLGMAGIAALIPLTLVLAEDAGDPVWIAAFGLLPLLVGRTIGGSLLAFGRLRLWNVLQILSTATTLAAMLVLVAGLSLDVAGALLAWLCAQILFAVVALVVSRSSWWPFELHSWRSVGSVLGLSLRFGSVSLVTLVHYRIELLLLQIFVGLEAVGIYSLATSLAELLWIVSIALSSAMVAPTVRSGAADAAAIAARAARHAVLATAAVGIPLALVGSFAIPLVYGAEFSDAREPLYLLIVAAVLVAPASPLAVYFSAKLGQARYAFVTAALSAVTTTLFALWLIPRYGVVGAAASTAIGYGISELAEMAWFVRVSGVSAKELVPRPSDLLAYRDLARSLLKPRTT